jgi:hypothetical protein
VANTGEFLQVEGALLKGPGNGYVGKVVRMLRFSLCYLRRNQGARKHTLVARVCERLRALVYRK